MLLDSPGFVVIHLQQDFQDIMIRQMRTKTFYLIRIAKSINLLTPSMSENRGTEALLLLVGMQACSHLGGQHPAKHSNARNSLTQ